MKSHIKLESFFLNFISKEIEAKNQKPKQRTQGRQWHKEQREQHPNGEEDFSDLWLDQDENNAEL